MLTRKPLRKIILLILAASLLAGCSFGALKETEDPMAIYTLAAGTVAAQLTGTAAMLPTQTETPQPTDTPEPTATSVPPTATLPAITQGAAATATLAQTAGWPTSTSVSQVSGDSAAYGSQTPADNSVFSTDEEITLMISMINNGSTTWNSEYKMVFQSGAQIAFINATPCSRETTKPMETCDFYIVGKTPINPGKYISRFWLVNPQGVKLPGGEVYFSFEVK